MAVQHHPQRLAPLFLLTVLASCATPEGDFPSLERRPFETDSTDRAAEPAAPAAPTQLTPELAGKVNAITARHKAANSAFNRALPRVQAIAQRASGSAQGSEAWVNAHLELSRLDHGRADSVAALGDLDELIAALADGDSAYVTLLTGYQEPMAIEVAAQRSTVERLSQLIGE